MTVMPVVTNLQEVRGSTSLQQLQSIERDYHNLDAQLDQVGKILQEPGLLDWNYLEDLKPAGRGPRFHGRLEWAARWILGKLHGSGSDGVNARSSAKAWILLGNLVGVLRPSFTSRTLRSHKFLTILEKALQETFGIPDSENDCVRIPDEEGDLANLNDNGALIVSDVEELSNLEAEGSRSSNRKRHADLSEGTVSKKRKTNASHTEHTSTSPPQSSDASPDQLHELFLAISRCLNVITTMSNHTTNVEDASSSEYMTSVLRTDCAQAARLLKCWLIALISLISCESSMSVARLRQTDVNLYSLLPSLQIWETRQVDGGNDPDVGNIFFSKECLLIIASYVRIDAEKDMACYTILAQNILTGGNTVIVERLLAKHLFIPAKAVFHRAQQPDRSGVAAASKDGQTNLVALLSPIGLLLQKALSRGDVGSVVARSIVFLFQLGIKLVPLSTPKKILTESPWLEYLFFSLSACLGFDISQADPITFGTHPISYLQTMLKTASRYKLLFKRNTLEALLSRYSGLSAAPHTAEPRWSLIAAIIALDANIFVSSRANGTDSETDLLDSTNLLLSSITRTVWTSTSFGLTGARPATDEARRSAYLTVKKDIIGPLMNVYASARNLSGFVTRWQAQLLRACEMYTELSQIEPHNVDVGGVDCEDANEGTAVSVWEDQDLVHALAEHLDKSLTLGQISTLLEQFAVDISNYAKAPTASEFDPRTMASLSTVNTILCALQMDENIRQLLPILKSLLADCMAILATDNSSVVKTRWRVWRLAATAHRLYYSIVDAATLADHSILDVESLAKIGFERVETASNSVEETNELEAAEAFASLGSLTQDLKRNHVLLQLILGSANAALNAVQQLFASMKDFTRLGRSFCFASIIATYPSLLMGDDATAASRRREILQLICTLASKQSSSWSAPDFASCWQSLVSASLDTCIPSLEDILRVMLKVHQASAKLADNLDSEVAARFLEEIYLQIPSAIIPRQRRDVMLDAILERIVNPAFSYKGVLWTRRLSLIAQLLQKPYGAARIATRVESMWNIARRLDHAFEHSAEMMDFETIFVFEDIVRSVLRHHIVNIKQKQSFEHLELFVLSVNDEIDGSQSYLERLGSIARTDVSSYSNEFALPKPINESNPLNKLGSLKLISVSSAVLDSIEANESSWELPKISENLCRVLCSTMDSLQQNRDSAQSPTATTLLANTILGAVNHLNIKTVLCHEVLLRETFANWVQRPADTASHDFSASDYTPKAFTFILDTRVRAHNGEIPNMDSAVEEFTAYSSQPAKKIMMETWIDAVQSAIPEKKLELFNLLLERSKQSNVPIGVWQLLHTFIRTAESPKFIDIWGGPELSIALLTLTKHIIKIRRMQSFMLIADTTVLVLRLKAKHISQNAIEAVLAAIIQFCSETGPPLPTTCTSRIFKTLCTMMQTLISHHRRKLRGRFNLLTPALQGLLRCLFTSDASLRGTKSRIRHPPWIFPGHGKITPRHASAYVRILTSICDPSTSSVSSAPSKSNGNIRGLTDETRKARGYAGQYMPAVLMELCQCQLHGRLGPGVREALMPGVYAMFDVVGQERLEAENARCSAPARVVFKVLYEEWKRMGRWKER